ncbi:UDP-N-acetylglucosamine 2-epimerase [Clostridiaceae bacterium M8S5]|nr:UDP-N-acetylglucosamine 2-epimerase [Clostridiaceae bacterium M8S5]
MKNKICVVTGSRAEYGLLYALMKEIDKDPELQLQLIVTGMHLSPEFGLTYKEIERDGFSIDSKIEMLLSSDTPIGISKSIGLGIIGFADALDKLQPDLLILLGDRYEILAVAQSAMIAKIPVAHIAGGDITEGAFDEAIRHSITKMSHIHFVTNESSRQIVKQLGENTDNIYNIGNPSIERIKSIKLVQREKLEKAFKFIFQEKNLLITFHPVTLERQSSSEQFIELLKSLDTVGSEIGLIFTKPNADPQGKEIINLINKFADRHINAVAFTSLGQQYYFSFVAQVDAVVGNSSSGICEVPYFNKPTVNIGDRQKGRMIASSIINCIPCKDEIDKAIKKALEMDCKNVVFPYNGENSSIKMHKVIKSISDFKVLLKKHFYKVGERHGK